MQDCISKPAILFNEKEWLLISDFLETLFQKKEFALIEKLSSLWDGNAPRSPFGMDNSYRREPMGLTTANKINRITKYVEENYQRQITVGEVAGMVGLSENAFSRFFKKCTGLRFISYVNDVRIREAVGLLCKTDDTVAGIAYNTGFNTPYYFNKVFKQSKGMTPGEYRALYIKEHNVVDKEA